MKLSLSLSLFKMLATHSWRSFTRIPVSIGNFVGLSERLSTAIAFLNGMMSAEGVERSKEGGAQ